MANRKYIQTSICLVVFGFTTIFIRTVFAIDPDGYPKPVYLGNESARTKHGLHSGASRPTKYLLYDGDYGRFNNQLMSFMSALCLGNRTNRTVIFPGWYTSDSTERLNFDTYMEVLPETTELFPFMEYDVFLAFASQYEITDSFRIQHNFYNGSRPAALELLTVVNESQNTVVDVGVIFFKHGTLCPVEHLGYLYSHVIPNKRIRELGEYYIERTLKKPFAALHLRKLEGLCQLDYEGVKRNILEEPRFGSMKSFFLASDKEDIAFEQKIIEEFKAVQTPSFILGPSYTSGILDVYVLSRSRLLYANLDSTLSITAIRYKVYWHRDTMKVIHLKKGSSNHPCRGIHSK